MYLFVGTRARHLNYGATIPIVYLRLASELGKPVINGGQVMTLQAVEQFVVYTGICPSDELIQQAQAFARDQ